MQHYTCTVHDLRPMWMAYVTLAFGLHFFFASYYLRATWVVDEALSVSEVS